MSQNNDFITVLWRRVIEVLNAIALINLVSDLFPTLVKWQDFFVFVLSFVSDLRDFVFYPFTQLLKWSFDITVPVWIRSYIFLGIIIFSTINYAHRMVCGFSLVYVSFNRSAGYLSLLWNLISSVLFFPMYFYQLIKYYFQDKENRVSRNVYAFFGIYLKNIALIILLFIVTNYILFLSTQ